MQDHAARGAAPAAPAAWLMTRSRWWRLALAALAGGAMALGQPPVSVPWALFLALPILVWLIDAAPGAGSAALAGWGAGFGYFVSSLHWVGHAFLVDPERFAWMMPFAVTLLPALLALFWAAAFALARRVWPAGRWWRPLALGACLTLAEYARAHALTGFPWGLPGYVWVETPVMQAASWAGPFGVTLVTIAVAPLGLTGVAERRIAPVLTTILVFAGLWFWGCAALQGVTARAAADGAVLRIVQPNAEQRLKWEPENARVFYRRLLEATSAPPDPALGPPAAVIWPETAVPFLPAYKPELRQEIAAVAGGVPVLLGALHARLRDGKEEWLNTLTAILPDSSLGPRYDKHHLVPFGEYLPYEAILARIGLRRLVPLAGFTPGPGPRLMEVPGLPPFSPLICYEMIFPDAVVPAGPRPAWLLQVTNDGWFGTFAGPQQHLAQARIRAIEQGLPVVRAANTGISAAIDAAGRVVTRIPLGSEGYRDFRLPAAMPATFYARHGDLPAMALVLILGFLCARARGARGRA